MRLPYSPLKNDSVLRSHFCCQTYDDYACYVECHSAQTYQSTALREEQRSGYERGYVTASGPQYDDGAECKVSHADWIQTKGHSLQYIPCPQQQRIVTPFCILEDDHPGARTEDGRPEYAVRCVRPGRHRRVGGEQTHRERISVEQHGTHFISRAQKKHPQVRSHEQRSFCGNEGNVVEVRYGGGDCFGRGVGTGTSDCPICSEPHATSGVVGVQITWNFLEMCKHVEWGRVSSHFFVEVPSLPIPCRR